MNSLRHTTSAFNGLCAFSDDTLPAQVLNFVRIWSLRSPVTQQRRFITHPGD